ncbi:MAG: sel1 repeat family protein [Prevotella sp.]|nr:sel1 repeat family protein [Prevotella sp.]
MKTTSKFYRQIILATLLAFVALPVAAQKWDEDKITDAAIEKSKDFEKGFDLYCDHKYREAIHFFEKAAREEKIAYSWYMEGQCYEKLGFKQKANFWYSMGAQSGDPKSQYKLGESYLLGDGVNEDEQKGAMWITKSAQQGYWGAQFMLGSLYITGGVTGVEYDEAKARYWMQKAADQGSEDAIKWLEENY